MTDAWREAWLSEHLGGAFREVMYKRATGALPEMESSKAAAKRVSAILREGDRLLDVGCGVGHYLRSLDAATGLAFDYTGADASPTFVEAAREAFRGRPQTRFELADIFELPFEDAAFDIVMSNNVLLHLPSVAKPLQELCRVARRRVLVRTLVGDSSFRVLKSQPGEDGKERFDARGEPEIFTYFNIYGRDYVAGILSDVPRAKSWRIEEDRDFDPASIDNRKFSHMVGDWQVSGYLLLPWCFVEIEIG